MAAVVTSIQTLTASAWTDVTPAGVLIVEAFNGDVLLCLSSASAGATALTAAAISLGHREKVELDSADLGGANVLVRADDLSPAITKAIVAK